MRSSEATTRQRKPSNVNEPLQSHAGGYGFRKDAKVTTQPNMGGDIGHATIVTATYVVLVALAAYGLWWVPQPLGLDADARVFSEGRALKHAAYLSEDIRDRKVGTHGVEVAAQYVLAEVNAIADLARSNPRLTAQVEREQVSGGVNCVFAGVRVANAYSNLTNVILSIGPREGQQGADHPALLLNAHFDSLFGTKGASDCGACVGVMLEAARVLASNPDIKLSGPVVFLFNGGEETLLLAAHGFMNQSKWATGLGAFINLESTGPGGPAYVFQHTGGWTVEAYAKAAKYPFASVVAQDFFDSRVLAMDTDFRMLSGGHLGTLPGIDIAYILDGAAYHTQRDTVDRIRKGTVQANGDNIVAAIQQFTQELAAQHASGAHRVMNDNSVYFDLLGRYLVTYPWKVARILHTAPLALAVATTLFLAGTSGGTKPSIRVNLGGVAFGALLVAASVLLSVLLPAMLGALRTAATGRPMVWFGKPATTAGIYLPAALAGLLLPFALAHRRLPSMPSLFLGFSLVHGGFAAALTAAHGRSGFISAGWALAGVLTAFITSQQGPMDLRRLLTVLAAAVPVGLMASPFITTLPLFVMEHISISGAPPPPFGHLIADSAIGAVLGLAVVLTAGFYGVLLAVSSRRLLRAAVAVLLITAIACATEATVFREAYSADFPKRVLLQHLHTQDASGNVMESQWAIAGLDAIPVSTLLPGGTQANQSTPQDWLGLFPLSRLLRGVTIPAPPLAADLLESGQPPIHIHLVRRESTEPDAQRLHLEIQSVRPGWGALNVTGDVMAWSFANDLQPSSIPLQGGSGSFLVRFAGNEGSERWPFWLDVKGGGAVEVDLAMLFHDDSLAIKAFVASLPDWTNAMPMTGIKAHFTF